MQNEQPIQERVYISLEAALAGGDLEPGSRLQAASIAEWVGGSVTPAREALFRMVGERRVEIHHDGGFRIWRPDMTQLHDVYYWNAQHLLAALHVTPSSALETAFSELSEFETVDAQGCAVRVADIFSAIGEATANGEFAIQIDQSNRRLHPIRLVEPQILPDTADELRRLVRLGRFDVKKNVRRRILAYHRRRIEHVSQIVSAL